MSISTFRGPSYLLKQSFSLLIHTLRLTHSRLRIQSVESHLVSSSVDFFFATLTFSTSWNWRSITSELLDPATKTCFISPSDCITSHFVLRSPPPPPPPIRFSFPKWRARCVSVHRLTQLPWCIILQLRLIILSLLLHLLFMLIIRSLMSVSVCLLVGLSLTRRLVLNVYSFLSSRMSVCTCQSNAYDLSPFSSLLCSPHFTSH